MIMFFKAVGIVLAAVILVELINWWERASKEAEEDGAIRRKDD